MARMHPEEIEESENSTEGERKVFRFLREAARPDSEFIGWYESAIGGRAGSLILCFLEITMGSWFWKSKTGGSYNKFSWQIGIVI